MCKSPAAESQLSAGQKTCSQNDHWKPNRGTNEQVCWLVPSTMQDNGGDVRRAEGFMGCTQLLVIIKYSNDTANAVICLDFNGFPPPLSTRWQCDTVRRWNSDANRGQTPTQQQAYCHTDRQEDLDTPKIWILNIHLTGGQLRLKNFLLPISQKEKN